MSYCLAINLKSGLIFLSDTRVNAGIDNVQQHKKLQTWSRKRRKNSSGLLNDDCTVALMTAGNLSITQMIVEKINDEIEKNDHNEEENCILNCKDMHSVAKRIGDMVKSCQEEYRLSIELYGHSSDASIIVGGKIGNDQHRLFNIYSAGNFIESTVDMPYFQLGEFKYGRAILDWFVTQELKLEDGVTVALLSMDVTMRSNMAVGAPIDLAILKEDSHRWTYRRIGERDERLSILSREWNEGVRMLISKIPNSINIDESDSIDVFISYKSEEREIVKPLSDYLEDKGFKVWWDVELIGGEGFRKQILAKLEAAKSVIVIWTEKSVSSDWVLDEADQARGQGKLIPVRVESLDTKHLPLGHRQNQTLLFDDYDSIVRALAALGVGPS